jgi:M6 family metalloprotease-like protein
MRRTLWSVGAGQLFLGTLLLLSVPPARGLEKPTHRELQEYMHDGSLPARIERARSLGNQRVRADVVRRAGYRSRLLQHEHETAGPPPAWEGMPTQGTVRTFALLIAFSDEAPVNSAASIDSKLFGDGGGGYPYESLRNYYRRSSYGQLEIEGATLGWYTAPYPRSSVADNESVIKDALSSLDAAHDFSRYDNDGDGVIDYFLVFWTGKDNGWGNFWWAYQARFKDLDYRIDGKTLRDYSWQWESRPAGGPFAPNYAIHETGHALGLPDYYDYDWGRGPAGGIGGLDMMDATQGDHNCFSKFLLGWISPQIVSSSTTAVSLRPSGLAGDAVVFARGATGDVLSEYFMLQNRTRTGNDVGLPGDGLLIWHVDARLDVNGTDFQSDNSYTPHKLLRLMEADGKEELERIDRYSYADAADYFVAPTSLTHWTRPGTMRYDGTPSFMQVVDISAAGDPMTARIEEVWDATPPGGAPSVPVDDGASTALDRVRFRWTAGSASDPDSGIAGYELQVGTAPARSDVFGGFVGNLTTWSVSNVEDGGTYYARVRALNAAGQATPWSEASDGILVSWPAFACAAVDECQLAFETSGDASWEVDETFFEHGSRAARGGALGEGETSTLRARVSGPGRLAFRWALVKAAGCELSVSVDGGEAERLTPASPTSVPAWASAEVAVPVGVHVVRWSYSSAAGTCAAAAYIDHVQWTADASRGGIAGRVTDAATGQGLAGVAIYFYGPVYSADWTVTDASGRYFSLPMVPDTYRARTANVLGYVEKMYSNRTCVGGYCTIASGTPIPVTASTTTEGIDFAIERGGRIAGVVSDEQTGRGIAGASVYVFDSTGNTIAGVAADGAGGYSTEPLPPGSYRVGTWVGRPYRDELYDDVPCPNWGCSLGSGKLVSVSAGETTPAIHFRLSGYGRLAGRVTHAGESTAIAAAAVSLYDASGALVTILSTDATGSYSTWWTVPDGTYYAVASAPGFAEELFQGLPCPRGSCVVTDGTQLAVSTGMTAWADFTLHRPALGFHTVEPCRLLDSREADGPFAGQPLGAGVSRALAVAGRCGIPPTARAVVLNVTATAPTDPGHLTVFTDSTVPPLASVVNFGSGQTRAGAATALLDLQGGVVIHSGQTAGQGTVHIVIDTTGYFE